MRVMRRRRHPGPRSGGSRIASGPCARWLGSAHCRYTSGCKVAHTNGGVMQDECSRIFVAAAALASLAGAGSACGQEYPNRIIKIITAAAGGGSDFIARIIAQGISGPLGQQIIIDNKGTGVLAGEAAVKAPGDGYTLTVQGGAFWIGPLLRKTAY